MHNGILYSIAVWLRELMLPVIGNETIIDLIMTVIGIAVLFSIILTSALGGTLPAIFCASLCFLSAWYWFIPPFGTFALDAKVAFALGFFTIIAIVDITGNGAGPPRWSGTCSTSKPRSSARRALSTSSARDLARVTPTPNRNSVATS